MTSLTSFSVMFGGKAKKAAAPKKASPVKKAAKPKPTAEDVQAKLEKSLAKKDLGKVQISVQNAEIIVKVYQKYVDKALEALTKLCGKGKPSTFVCGPGTKARPQFSLDGFTVKVHNFISKAAQAYLDSTPNAGAICRKPGSGLGGRNYDPKECW